MIVKTLPRRHGSTKTKLMLQIHNDIQNTIMTSARSYCLPNYLPIVSVRCGRIKLSPVVNPKVLRRMCRVILPNSSEDGSGWKVEESNGRPELGPLGDVGAGEDSVGDRKGRCGGGGRSSGHLFDCCCCCCCGELRWLWNLSCPSWSECG